MEYNKSLQSESSFYKTRDLAFKSDNWQRIANQPGITMDKH